VIVIVIEDDHPSAAVIFSLSLSESSITSLGPTAAWWWRQRQVPYLPCRAEPSQAQRSGYGVKLETVAQQLRFLRTRRLLGKTSQKTKNHQIIANLAIFSRLLTTIPCCFLRTGNALATRGPEMEISKPQEQNVLAPFASQA
jgi:hypothetical protein